MRLQFICVGRARGVVGEAVAEYETRLRHYFSYDVAEVREEPFRRATDADRVREQEGKRLLARVPAGAEVIALHRSGAAWSSDRLARYLGELSSQSRPSAVFLIGGAFGLADEVLRGATYLLSLSSFTLPHELARLVLTEQLYRAGTILRGEPYHKGSARGGGP